MTHQEIRERFLTLLSQSQDELLPMIAAVQDSAISCLEDESKCESVEHSVRVWQMKVRELLTLVYGQDDIHLTRFSDTISNFNILETSNPRRHLRRELYGSITYIEALIPFLELVDLSNNKISITMDTKTPKLFISHSSKDISFVEALVGLLEFLGFNETNLFCSSVEGYGIRIGQNIFDYLRNQFYEHELFVIFVHSPHYYGSYVSLNEMGAAWILKKQYFSFLTKDTSFSLLKGVVTSEEIAVKVDAADAKLRLNELRKVLTEHFDLTARNDSRWESKRDEFLKIVNE